MTPFISYGYSQDSSNLQSMPNFIAQPFETNNHVSSWSLGPSGSRPHGSSFAAGSDPKWFTDFIHCDFDDSPIQAQSMGGPQTSELVTTPPFALSPTSSPPFIDPSFTGSSDFGLWPRPIRLINTDDGMTFDANSSDFPWTPAQPALTRSISDFLGTSSDYSHQYSLRGSSITQNDVGDRRSLPQMPFLKCPACQSLYPTECRLRYVLEVYQWLPR
jgi:hypothetical protein